MARLAVARSAIHVRSKGPRPKGGVDPEAALAVVGSRAVGCADHARASGRDAPPYALLHFGADFSTFRVETHFSQGAHGFPMAHSSLFWWAIGGPRGPHTPGTVVALRGAWPTGRGLCVTRGPHIPTALLAPSGRSTGGLSAQYNGGAGSAPRPASPTRACYIYGVAGAPGICGIPRRRRGRGATHGRHLVCCPDLWEGLPAPPQPRAMVRNSCLLPPAEYRQLCAIAGVWFATDGCVVRCRCPQVGTSFGTPHAPGVPTCL